MKTTIRTALMLLVLAPEGTTQLTGKQADDEARAIAKQTKKAHAAAVQLRTAAMVDAIEAFTEAAPGDVDPAFTALFDAVELYQQGLFEDFRELHATAVGLFVAALDDFAQGQPLAGVYPAEFYFGIGKALDDLRADMQAAQSKSLAKVRKRLAKAATKLAKATDARMSIHLELATTQGNEGFIQGMVTSYTRIPLLVHTAMALGHADSADTGTLLVGGMGESVAPISVSAVGETQEIVPAEFFLPEEPYWHVRIDNGGAGMADGNYLIGAHQDTAASSFGAFVSVR